MLKYILLTIAILSPMPMHSAGLFTSCDNEYSDPHFSGNEADSENEVEEIIASIVDATKSTVHSAVTSILQYFGTLQDTTINPNEQTPELIANIRHPESAPEVNTAPPAPPSTISRTSTTNPEDGFEMITIRAFKGDNFSDGALADREDSFELIENTDE